MRSVKKLLAVGITSLLAVAMAVPALPQDPQSQGPVIRSQVSLVNLFVTVRDKSKRIATDLKKEDFKLLEDGKAQNIAVFEFQKLEEIVVATPPPAPCINTVSPGSA